MFKSELGDNEGLFLSPCKQIHMMFMKFKIDAIFVDSKLVVQALYKNLRPWTGITSWHTKAKSVIEVKSGNIEKSDVIVGDTLIME